MLFAPRFGKDFRYLVESMSQIEPESTEVTFREAERVRSQIDKNLSPVYNVNFDFQGSVSNDTHIKRHSDIDLLALTGCFWWLDPGEPPPNPYKGDWNQDLNSMRSDVVNILEKNFPTARVDSSPGKSVEISEGSLARKVDVVISSWWNTKKWRETGLKRDRGIKVLDSNGPPLISNLPFLHNFRIDEKDLRTNGLRKVIRLLKTLKYDAAPELSISSYDVAALAYNMDDSMLNIDPGNYLGLAQNANSELLRFIAARELRASMSVPNGTRLIFGNGGASVSGLIDLQSELGALLQRIQHDLRNLNENFSMTKTASVPSAWTEVRPRAVLANSF